MARKWLIVHTQAFCLKHIKCLSSIDCFVNTKISFYDSNLADSHAFGDRGDVLPDDNQRLQIIGYKGTLFSTLLRDNSDLQSCEVHIIVELE